MKNIYFIQLPISSSMHCLPQAIGTIWSYCEQFNEIKEEYKLAGVWWDEPIDIIDPFIVAASCYMWNWKETYDIIKKIKKTYPKCLIVVGGPDPKYTSEWCLEHPEIDAVVAYYGEETFKNLLILKSLDIPGIVTKDFNNSSSAIYAPAKNIPSPYLNGFFDSLLSKITKPIRTVFEGNRGCPYSCSFCDIGSIMYQKIQMFDTDRCIKELEWMINKNVITIDVADSNFGMFPRDEQIVDFIIKKTLEKKFNGSFMPTWAKNNSERVIKLAKKLQLAGVEKVFGFSLQSTNPETLKNVKRTNIYDIDGFIPILRDLENSGVNTYTELIFPMPGDTVSSFKKGINQILDMPVSFQMIQINTLSRLSNTEFNTGFLSLKWANVLGTARSYDNGVTDEICISTDTLTEEEVFECLFFSRGFIIPMYWYGISTYVADYVHNNNIMTRSKWFENFYNDLNSESWFIKQKQYMKDHYFNAINNNDHLGYYINNMYYTDTAFSHYSYIKNNIFDIMSDMYPTYKEIIYQNKHDFKQIDNVDDWLKRIHINGRFSRSWKKIKNDNIY